VVVLGGKVVTPLEHSIGATFRFLDPEHFHKLLEIRFESLIEYEFM